MTGSVKGQIKLLKFNRSSESCLGLKTDEECDIFVNDEQQIKSFKNQKQFKGKICGKLNDAENSDKISSKTALGQLNNDDLTCFHFPDLISICLECDFDLIFWFQIQKHSNVARYHSKSNFHLKS